MRFSKYINNINVKVSFIVVLTVLASYISVYALGYFFTYNMIIDDIKKRSIAINRYIQGHIDLNTFTSLKALDDESSDIYLKTQQLLDNIRLFSNIQYLYTAKLNENCDFIYLVDGLNSDDPDFRHIGDLIEHELISDLSRCLAGDAVTDPDIIDTFWGHVYVSYWPVEDEEGNILGAVGMEFNVDNIYEHFRKMEKYLFFISATLIAVIILSSRFFLKKISNPYLKKLTYEDFFTGMNNRLSFEIYIKEIEKIYLEKEEIVIAVFNAKDKDDAYIKNLSKVVQTAFNDVGKCFRINDEDFAAIVIGHSPASVQKSIDLRFKGTPYGIAAFDSTEDRNLHDTFIRAEALMCEMQYVYTKFKA